jgi:N-methylhydantoinase A
VSGLRVAVDTGGTFTDFVLLDEATGDLSIAKILSSPHDPSVSVMTGVERFQAEDPARTIEYFCHGTTVGTNALLEQKGVRTGLLVTAGFRGIYEIMEQARPHGPALFDLDYDKPALLAPESRTGEVVERVDHTGAVLRSLDEVALRATLRRMAAEKVESIAVCLLFSYLHPAHELRVREIVHEELPGCAVSLSCEVLPQIREYARLSTTVVNAYLQPIVARYLANLRDRLHHSGVTTAQAYVMQSNGGTATFDKAGDRAAATLLSGPAGGVTAGARLSALCGLDKVITFDMGGTSCDVALIEGGRPGLGSGGVIAGRQVALASLDIDTVSAGGGTLASVDAQGVLVVGPDSAGSVPGPACYGRGGVRPTVTDANLVLGYLSDASRLGGSLALDEEAALAAVREHVAGPLGLDPVDAARGIVDVVNIQMQEAIKGISTMRGYDLREFVLIGFGGAGPVHAAALADDLHMAGVLIPAHPGVLSALGLLMADVQHDYVRSKLDRLDAADPDEVRAIFADLAAQAKAELVAEGFRDGDGAGGIALDLALDMRYLGQGYEVRVEVDPQHVAAGEFGLIRKAFDAEHLERFGHSAPGEAAEIVSYRLTGRGLVPEVRLPEHAPAGRTLADALVSRRAARFGTDTVDCPVYARDRLDVGMTLTGPAVIDQQDTTVVVLPGQVLTVDRYLNLFLAPVPSDGSDA